MIGEENIGKKRRGKKGMREEIDWEEERRKSIGRKKRTEERKGGEQKMRRREEGRVYK